MNSQFDPKHARWFDLYDLETKWIDEADTVTDLGQSDQAQPPSGATRMSTLETHQGEIAEPHDGTTHHEKSGKTEDGSETTESSKREPIWKVHPPAKERIGLALSGGGIRSATFNLGVLQKLHKLKILDRFDYLATVSGGGYVGGFWSAWRARRACKARKEEATTPDPPFPAKTDDQTDDGREPNEIRHLREFSNFLRPRPKLLSSETGTITAGVAGAVLPSLVIALSLLACGLSLWVLLAYVVLGEPWSPALPWLMPAAVVFGVTAMIQASFEIHWRRHHSAPDATPPDRTGTGNAPNGEKSDSETRKNRGERRTAIIAGTVACVAAGGFWVLLWQLVPLPFETVLHPARSGDAGLAATTVLLPALAWIATTVLLVIGRVAMSRRVRSWEDRCRKGALDRVLSRVVLCGAAWAALALIWIAGQRVAAEGIGWIVTLASGGGAAGGLFTWARGFLGRQPNKPSGGKLRFQLGFGLVTILAYLVVAALSVAVAALLVYLKPWALAKILWAAGVSLLVLVLAARFFDPQQNGFHAFYRQRLVRAFLGASNQTARDEETAEDEHDDLQLTSLAKGRPLHLICCAANDLAADPVKTLHRGARSAVLSPVGLQVGSSWTQWRKPTKAEEPDPPCGTQAAEETEGPRGPKTRERTRAPSLGSAMTASAAAFNSQMGSLSVKLGAAATFLLGAFGLRLGLWVENPQRSEAGTTPFSARLQRWFPGLLYLRELFGASHALSSWVHLSDGAHFENLALYELIRRHCRCILVCDCGADPDVAFDDFGNAVRRIREDFGVEIDIDLTPLRPGEGGLAAQPMVAGDIRYPSKDLGVLLYLKPTLVGDEPPDVAQYARRNDAFPHETTLDQFYDEAQWEAYRKLGEHITNRALGRLVDRPKKKREGADDATRKVASPSRQVAKSDGPAPDRVIRLFLRARYAWPPEGADDPSLTESVDRDWALLERRLEKKSSEALRVQLLPTAEGGATTRSPEELAAALPLIREALRLMETTILDTGMGARPGAPYHPRYMGWLNRFGRWTSAPLFLAWWPWLAPVHSQALRTFLQDTFDLPPVVPPGRNDREAGGLPKIRKLNLELCTGSTWSQWTESRRTKPRRTKPSAQQTLFGYFVPMPCVRNGEFLVAVTAVETSDDHGYLSASWCQEDFFVPPGLWGIGIGERFLEALVAELKEQGIDLVRVPSLDRTSMARKGQGIDLVTVSSLDRTSMARDALYIGAGFERGESDLILRL